MLRLTAVVFSLQVVALVGASVARGDAAATYTLHPGQAVFIDGPRDVDQPLPLPTELRERLCQAGAPGCIDYRLELPQPARRLRVAIDFGADFDLAEGELFGLYLLDPGGQVVDYAGGLPDLFYSAELFAERPRPGLWTARVVPLGASDATFRLRAKLEGSVERSGGDQAGRALLPNLRMTPPFEFSLETPANAAGYGFIGLDAAPARGSAPMSGCLASEAATSDSHGSACLRFSSGPENVGQGRLQLIFRPENASVTDGPAFQRIDRSDGTTEDVPAGRYVYHAEHAHYHHRAFARFELLPVTDRENRELQPATTARKQGFCMHDMKIVEWTAFANDPERTVAQSCAGLADAPTSETTIGLARGWADVYPYTLEGMYVRYDGELNGLYVVRVRANEDDSILESSRQDNASYALICVGRNSCGGPEFMVLERGYGTGPWDPHRRLVDDLVPLTADD